MRPVWQVTTQRPAVQTWPPGQAVPQAPQLLLSVVRSRHTPEQFVVPDTQLTAHDPPEHT